VTQAGPVTANPPGDPGLVARYEFEAFPAGTQIKDSSRNDLDGMLMGFDHHAAPAHDPVAGKHLELDGIAGGRFAEVPDDALLDVDTYTLTAWVNYRLDDQVRLEVLEKAGAYWMNIRADDEANTGRLRSGGFYGGCVTTPAARTWHFLDSATVLPEGEWVHIASTYDGSSLRIFLDGRPDIERTIPSATWGPTCSNIEPLAIGAKDRTIPPAVTEAFWNGGLDDVRVFSRALSEEEIRGVMAER
jgi:hypothetical protein